jgi:surface antigen
MNTARTVLGLIAATWVVAALADPPSHAPAHGWRKKNDAAYVGRSGLSWEHDFEIGSGRCNRDTIAAVVGGAVGGAIANRVADDHKLVATLIGITAGALIGHKIGSELDEKDRACFGHALEIGVAGRAVAWTNAATGVKYEMAPGADRQRGGAACREFTLVTTRASQKASQRGLACQSSPGAWRIVN